MQAPNVAGQPWYYTYGPCDYRFYDSVLGSREDLRELCSKADRILHPDGPPPPRSFHRPGLYLRRQGPVAEKILVR